MSEGKRLSHVSASGRARMVDVGDKATTDRAARAEAVVRLGGGIAEQLRATGEVAKGNVMETARIAGIMAAKRTADLIPLCHPLALSVVDVQATLAEDTLRLESFVRCRGVTGVEMEALIAVTVAALTVYDMCKAAGKGIVIERVRLLEKTGGKSGAWSVGEGASRKAAKDAKRDRPLRSSRLERSGREKLSSRKGEKIAKKAGS